LLSASPQFQFATPHLQYALFTVSPYTLHFRSVTSHLLSGNLQLQFGTPHLQYAPVIEPPYTLQIQFVTSHLLSATPKIPSVTLHQQCGTTRRNLQVRTFLVETCNFLLPTRARQVPTCICCLESVW
jgi:hypothetical protein